MDVLDISREGMQIIRNYSSRDNKHNPYNNYNKSENIIHNLSLIHI